MDLSLDGWPDPEYTRDLIGLSVSLYLIGRYDTVNVKPTRFWYLAYLFSHMGSRTLFRTSLKFCLTDTQTDV
jgi:hypothetical protein